MTVDKVIAKIIWLTFFGPPCTPQRVYIRKYTPQRVYISHVYYPFLWVLPIVYHRNASADIHA